MTELRQFIRRRAPAYGAVIDLFAAYFLAYGGFRAVVRSPYAHAAVLISAITTPIWTMPGWWDLPLSILPNLIGFTLSGYAVMMTLGNQRLRTEMTRPISDRPSAFMATNATFFHFLVLQIVAMLIALLAKSRPFSSVFDVMPLGHTAAIARRAIALTGWAFGYCIFVYALTSAMAAAAAIFRVGRWFEWSMKHPDDSDSGQNESN